MRWRDARTDPPPPFLEGKPYLVIVRWFRVSGVFSATAITPNQLADRVKVDFTINYGWLDEETAPDSYNIKYEISEEHADFVKALKL